MGEKEMKTQEYDYMNKDLTASQQKINISKFRKSVKNHVLTKIESCRIFKIPKELSNLFVLTDPIEMNVLPFENVFIEQKIAIGNNAIKGIFLSQLSEEEMRELPPDIKNKIFVYAGMFIDGLNSSMTFLLNDKIREFHNNYNEFDPSVNLIDTVSMLVNNFLCFVNSPDIEYVTKIDTPRDTKIRKRKGKPQRPPIANIILTDPIKRYLSKQRLGEKMVYSHRFWVRGHWRVLRDKKRYGENSGKTIWIKPHIKGDGLLINKNYELRT